MLHCDLEGGYSTVVPAREPGRRYRIVRGALGRDAQARRFAQQTTLANNVGEDKRSTAAESTRVRFTVKLYMKTSEML